MDKQELKELLDRQNVNYKVQHEGENFIAVTTSDRVFVVINTILAKCGVKSEGRSGGGIESYLLDDRRLLNVAFPFKGDTIIYLGPEGKAY